MPHNEKVALSGAIQHVFAHRFTLQAEEGVVLADLGPKGAESFALEPGLTVKLEGERRPSEIKVSRIEAQGRAPVEIHHKKPNHAPESSADPARAIASVGKAGWTAEGEPKRKPKHFEFCARKDGGALTELHVDFDGKIYKEKPLDADKAA